MHSSSPFIHWKTFQTNQKSIIKVKNKPEDLMQLTQMDQKENNL